MDKLEDISPFVRSLEASIDNLSDALDPVFSKSLEDSIANCLLPQEKAKIYHSHLYTVISILYSYIKVLGIKTETHPIMKELTRIKISMKTFKEIEESLSKKNETSEKSAEAANQFLQRTLGTTGGSAAPDSLKSPAISSANFKGTHTKFSDEEEKESSKEILKKTIPTKRSNPNKVSKPKKQRR